MKQCIKIMQDLKRKFQENFENILPAFSANLGLIRKILRKFKKTTVKFCEQLVPI